MVRLARLIVVFTAALTLVGWAPHPKVATAATPDVCSEYQLLEQGKATDLRRQDEFNHLTYQQYAQRRMRCVYPQWGPAEWPCLRQLWREESSWSATAGGSPRGSYGIPQSYPGTKMAVAGAAWLHDGRVQIRWGLGYIASRYRRPTRATFNGTPCHAGY